MRFESVRHEENGEKKLVSQCDILYIVALFIRKEEELQRARGDDAGISRWREPSIPSGLLRNRSLLFYINHDHRLPRGLLLRCLCFVKEED